MINDPDDFSGDFDAVALVVGANNIGNYSVREVVETIDETMEILKYLNPGACVFATEVGLKICRRRRIRRIAYLLRFRNKSNLSRLFRLIVILIFVITLSDITGSGDLNRNTWCVL